MIPARELWWAVVEGVVFQGDPDTGNRGRVPIVAVHRETRHRIEDYLADAGHGGDEAAPLFRPVANNRGGGRLDRALDPASIYRNVVRHYAARSGLA